MSPSQRLQNESRKPKRLNKEYGIGNFVHLKNRMVNQLNNIVTKEKRMNKNNKIKVISGIKILNKHLPSLRRILKQINGNKFLNNNKLKTQI